MTGKTGAKRGPKLRPEARSNLVQVGLRLIHSDGYAATGIQGIADGAAVPKGTFYTHFESKEAFGAEVMDAYFERNETRLRDFLGNTELAPLKRMEAYFDDRIEAFRSIGFTRGCLLGNFSAEAADHIELLRQHVAAHLETWTGYFERCIAEAQVQGAVGEQFPPALLARFVMNSWQGSLLRMRVEHSDAALMEFKAVMFGSLLT